MTTSEKHVDRIVCPACATEQQAPEAGGPAACVMCGASLVSTPSSRESKAEAAPRMQPLPSARRFPEEPEPPGSIGRRRSSWPLLATGLVLAALAASPLLCRHPARDDTVKLAAVENDVYVLAGLARRYRAKVGTFPDSETWKAWVERGDNPVFYDPWHRPYLYSFDSKRFIISTLGADGKPGGEGVDADLRFSFRNLAGALVPYGAAPVQEEKAPDR